MYIYRGYEKGIELKQKNYRSIPRKPLFFINFYNLLIICNQSGSSYMLDFCTFRELLIKQVKIIIFNLSSILNFTFLVFKSLFKQKKWLKETTIKHSIFFTFKEFTLGFYFNYKEWFFVDIKLYGSIA